jgi:Domain of unknown function (DUF1707)
VPELRASDADREGTVVALRRHHADGRLTTDELEERIAAAWGARYVSELAGLMHDLPGAPPEPAIARPPSLPRMPGRVAFSVRWRAPAASGEAMAELLQYVAPTLGRAGYHLAERTPERAVFSRRRLPGWVPLVVVLAFPFGLLALLARTEDQIAVELVPEGEHETLIYVHGVAPRGIRRAFAELER